MDRVDCVVVGAGVVGLAIARALAQAAREVIILEAAEAIGTGISSRNSEVIHAGIYYPKDSLMARFCVAGKHALYAFCADHGVPHKRCGKLIVATNELEAGKLASIEARARANGVDDLRFLSATEAQALEPALACTGALLSPSTGIVDSHHLMLALLGDAEAAGASLALNAPLLEGRAGEDGMEISVGGADPLTLSTRLVVNAAGLEAPLIARNISGMPQAAVPTRYFAKGNYFTLTTRSPFSHLIYPVPEPGGLGVHLTLDLGGQAKFGPDVEWVEAIDYDVDPSRDERFYRAIRRYWPGLPEASLQPGYAGIRPKIVPPEIAAQDFVVQTPREHGVAGLINLFGIESPGLTSALALAQHVAQIAQSLPH
ncbi:MAG: NAD(P)/FAD-dependent oxidoreductase [Methylobacteriaceae bacterium]|nr:NAD(P)/FAD-dependent oxidoreductase [Methylobacteriaceae bacterium]